MNTLAFADLVAAALREDRADQDVTTLAVVPAEAVGHGRILAREPGVIAGLPVAEAVFQAVDRGIRLTPHLPDGTRVAAGDLVAELHGPLRALLSGERVALNFLQHLSGIATATARLADLVRDYPVRILDTRKTTPGLRALEKYAVRTGGGANHRFSLAEMVLIKDNHIAAAGGVAEAIRRARLHAPPYVRVEVEAENEAQVREALAAGADLIMLDNMTPAEMRRMVILVAGRAKLEASGRIDAENVVAVAATGVDYISSGAITHSAQALDLSLEIVEVSA
ncbi:MAG: carboxylating nicotinate-nucleotide diphosphorylase [Bacteroidota bacterium]